MRKKTAAAMKSRRWVWWAMGGEGRLLAGDVFFGVVDDDAGCGDGCFWSSVNK